MIQSTPSSYPFYMTICNEISSMFTASADDRILCFHKPMNIELVFSAPYNSALRNKSRHWFASSHDNVPYFYWGYI